MQQNEDAHSSVHEGNWKLIAYGDAFVVEPTTPVEYELYDLETDPGEKMNVADRHPEIVERLKRELRKFGALRKPGVGTFSEGNQGFKAPKDWVLPE